MDSSSGSHRKSWGREMDRGMKANWLSRDSTYSTPIGYLLSCKLDEEKGKIRLTLRRWVVPLKSIESITSEVQWAFPS